MFYIYIAISIDTIYKHSDSHKVLEFPPLRFYYFCLCLAISPGNISSKV